VRLRDPQICCLELVNIL